MTDIYIYDGEFKRGEEGYPMIQRGALMFAEKHGIELTEMPQIKVAEGGKPYFENCDIKFSLSHSGQMWMCAYSDNEIGVDIQEMKETASWEKIADRHFKSNEKAYVELWGIDGFFEIWSSKEAFGKMTGRGFFDEMPEMVDDNHDLIKDVVYNEASLSMIKIDIHPQIKCFLCAQDEEYSVDMLL